MKGEPIEFRVIELGSRGIRIEPYHRLHGRIGYANIHPVSNVAWSVDEVHIADEVPIPAWYQFQIGSWNFGGKPKTIRYRNREIITALMDFLKRYAQDHGVTEIEGSMSDQEIESPSQLLEWYIKQGFKIISRAAGSGKTANTRMVWRQSGSPNNYFAVTAVGKPAVQEVVPPTSMPRIGQ